MITYCPLPDLTPVWDILPLLLKVLSQCFFLSIKNEKKRKEQVGWSQTRGRRGWGGTRGGRGERAGAVLKMLKMAYKVKKPAVYDITSVNLINVGELKLWFCHWNL